MTGPLFLDIETNGLLPELDRIHCIALKELNTGEAWSYGPDKIKEGLKIAAEAPELIAHNGLTFDIPAIQKVYPNWKPKGKITDTLVLSRMIRPDLKRQDWDHDWKVEILPKKLFGSHSLKAWGLRLSSRFDDDSMLKTDYDGGWEHWSEEMEAYCRQDVVVCEALYNFLKPHEWPERAIELEHKMAVIAEEIGNNGWTFDERAAASLYGQLSRRRAELDDELQNLFEPWEIKEIIIPKVNNSKLGYQKGVPFEKVKVVEFNHQSRRHIEFCLTRKYGWKPEKRTNDGHAVIDDVVLGSLDYPEAKKLSELFLINKRLGQLAEGTQAWLKRVDADGKLRHRIIPIGCVTSRASHSGPNLGQVPAVRLEYGKECRDLFTVPNGYSLVGSDLSGLEIRAFAHFLNDGGEYAKVILESDIHEYNREKTGLATRDQAKTWLYATLYGASDSKIGKMVGKGSQAGKQLKENFINAVPAYGRLKTAVETAANRGSVKTLDGRRVPVRSPHAALNTLLQSAGSIISKQWVIFIDEAIKEQGLDAYIMAWVHDEVQIAVRKGLEDHVGNIARRSAEKAGEEFNFRIPIGAEYAIGRTWADTH